MPLSFEITNFYNINAVLSNVPLLIFDLFLLLVFFMILRSVLTIIFSGSNELRLQRGKNNLFASFAWFFLLITTALVFNFVARAIEGPVIPEGETGEFPVMPNSDFPPAPVFIKLGSAYFPDPLPLKDVLELDESIFAVLCRKGSSYDVVFADKTSGEAVQENENYNCWQTKCGPENLYITSLKTNRDNYPQERIEKIKTELKLKIKSPCATN